MSRHLQEQVLDRAAAMARVGGDLDLLKEIAALFLTSTRVLWMRFTRR